MNRKLLALAIGAALALPMAAQAAPSVYGLLNLSVDRVDLESQGTAPGQSLEENQLNSNSSRIGVKGDEALGNGLSAIYMAEWAVSGDVTGTTDLVGRNRFVGLKSDAFGALKLGAFDTPFKTSQGGVDLFNDMTYADMGNFISGENRLNNMIGYESPKIADMLTVNVAVQSGEETATGDDDALSASIAVETGGFYVAAAVDNDVVDSAVIGVLNDLGMAFPNNESVARDAMRVTGIYTADALQIGALFQTSEFANDEAGFDLDEEALLVSVAYKLDKNTLKAQFISSTVEDGAGSEFEATAMQFGVDHNFTQLTKVFAQVSMVTNDDGTTETEDTVASLGMESRF